MYEGFFVTISSTMNDESLGKHVYQVVSEFYAQTGCSWVDNHYHQIPSCANLAAFFDFEDVETCVTVEFATKDAEKHMNTLTPHGTLGVVIYLGNTIVLYVPGSTFKGTEELKISRVSERFRDPTKSARVFIKPLLREDGGRTA